MRKFALRLIGAVLALTATVGCSYDDTDIIKRVNDIDNRVTTLEQSIAAINGDIASLDTIVKALQQNIAVSEVTTTAEGYIIHFSDGTTAIIRHGNDGANGTNAPIISIAEEEGIYYWTIGGEWLLVDGERVRANGIDGVDGVDAVAPEVRINDTTKEWEISTDGGVTWTSTGVVAEGRDGEDGMSGAAGDSLFKGVDTSNDEYITVILADGTELRLARHDDTAPNFTVTGTDEPVVLEYGKSATLAVVEQNVADYTITKPEGWGAEYAEAMLTITAPSKELCHYDKEGVVAITAVSAEGKTCITKIEVQAGEWVDEVVLRTLTFEDEDAKFASYELYNGAQISTWSDLIDDPQYGGPLTYTDYMTDVYYWYDEDNTELSHSFETPYWGGGHAVSNYVLADYTTLPEGHYGWYELQFTTPLGGNNGSQNFCVHNGYNDSFNSQLYDASLNGFEFADGVERVIDHMYVTNTNYVLNSLIVGDGFNAPATDTTYFKIVAYGYNASDECVGSLEFTLCDGTDNILTTWEKWELSSLGKVAKIVFNFSASEDQSGSYGLNTPAYFAYDDVAVQFTEKVFK